MPRIYSVFHHQLQWYTSEWRAYLGCEKTLYRHHRLCLSIWQSSFKYIDINYVAPSPPPLQLLGYRRVRDLRRGYHSSIRYCRYRVAIEAMMAKGLILIGKCTEKITHYSMMFNHDTSMASVWHAAISLNRLLSNSLDMVQCGLTAICSSRM